MTADALARAVGITENAVRKLEAGSSKEPRFSTGLRLAAALDAPPGMLLGGPRAKASGAPDLAFIISSIRAIRPELESRGIAHVSVFGSVARGDASRKSDVDLIVQPKDALTFSLVELGHVSDILQKVSQPKVDVLTLKTVQMARFGEEALKEAVVVF